MNRYNKIITLGTILLLLPMSNTSAQVISVSNLNIGDTFRFSYTKVSQMDMVNGTEYPSEFSVELVDQYFNMTVIGGYYEPKTLSNPIATDMALIIDRPYDAGITHTITFDNESLNDEEVSNATSHLDYWIYLYFGYVYNFENSFLFVSPTDLIDDFDIPYTPTILLEASSPIVSYFVNNNESFYQQYLPDTDGPVIEQNSTTMEDGTDNTTYDKYLRYESSLDLDADIVKTSMEMNYTMYGNIGDIEWYYGFYSQMEFDIDYGRGIVTSYDILLQMPQAYDDGYSSTTTKVASEEYVPPIVETTTSQTDSSTTDDLGSDDPTLDLDYPFYSLISICLIGVMIRFRRSK